MFHTSQFFVNIWKTSCILSTIGLAIFTVYTFSLNRDANVIDMKLIDVHPSASICFTAPFEAEKLKRSYNISSVNEYGQFLSGEGE